MYDERDAHGVAHIAFGNIYSRKETVYTVYQEARSDSADFERHLGFYNIHGIDDRDAYIVRLGLVVYGHRLLGISMRAGNKPARHRESGEAAAWKLPEHITDPLRCASCMIMIGSDQILLFSDSCSIESRFLSLLTFDSPFQVLGSRNG